MAHITFHSTIPDLVQTVHIDGADGTDAWCTSISTSAGLGATTATIELPFATADQVGNRYGDRKVTVRAGLGSASRIAFIGFLSGRSEDISETADGVSLTAYTAGHYIGGIGVGEENDAWNYKYPLFSDVAGTPTGLTPAMVLKDLFDRLPKKWTDEIDLGNITALSDSYDLPVQNYEFSLSTYADAIDSIVSSMGDVMVRERFSGDKILLDFVRISNPSAPRCSVTVAEFTDSTSSAANVASYQPTITTDELINRAMAYGTDKQFMITTKNIVDGLTAQSETDVNRALVGVWDPALEPMVLSDPKLASSDRVNRSLTIQGSTPPGTGGTTFPCDVGIDLIPNKCLLVHQSGERMLVTAYTPRIPAQPLAEPPVAEVKATVTVQRLFQPAPGQTPGNLAVGNKLTVEVPGISNVFRQYQLPAVLATRPRKEFLSDLPLIDPATQERYDAQVFIYKSNLSADDADTSKKTGTISVKPSLVTDCKKEFTKFRIQLREPAVVPITVQKGSDGKVKTMYAETVVGVTLAYIDPAYPFGHDTGDVDSQLLLPWKVQTERVKLDEFVYWQATNIGFPVFTATDVPVEFPAQFIEPLAETVSTGAAVLRNDIDYLRTAAERILSEKNRPHVSAPIEVPWLDLGYQIGNRLDVRGLSKQPEELLSITQVSWSMTLDGDSSTSITVDNVKPPARKQFNTKLNKAV